MRSFLRLLAWLPAVAGLLIAAHGATPPATMSKEQIIAEGERVADAQLAQLASSKPDISWVPAVMWAGFAEFSHVSPKGAAYTKAIDNIGERCKWTPPFRQKEPFHADDLCICQTFLDAYETNNDPARIGPTESRLQAVSDHIGKELPDDPKSKTNNLTWWWCDALFMAPEAHARLSALTQDPKYIDAMNTEWWRTTALLYDKDEHLFYRDKSFFGKRAGNGKKVFWTRGNGWAFAGLARTLTYISESYPDRPKYITLFKEMAAKLASLQQPDGTWRPSLLDPDEFPDSEMSGTALDCFAFAWGVDNGILDRDTYLPVAAKAWAALLASRRPDGLIGYVQGVGAAPAPVVAAGTQLYATGAFLMAASELSRLAPIAVPPPPKLTDSPSGALSKIADTVVDASALTLQPKSEFGSTINGQAFQQDIIHTSAGWQYVAYYDGQRHVCVARRHLPDGPWQILRLTDYGFKGNDAHNTISLGICEKDGTIHLAFDHHVTPLHYRVSKTGVATHPENFPWEPALFSPVHSDLEAGKPIKVTYPRFWNTPDGGLQMHYREGGSGSGNNMLVDYHPETGTWSGTRQIDSLMGNFQDDLGGSKHRNAYPNGYDYDSSGRLQATWTWRESAGGVNHDLLYDYSNDGGKTWFNDLDQPITGPASLDTPGITVEKISRRHGLMNNQAQAVDSKKRIHVVMWSSSVETPLNAAGDARWGAAADRRYHHYWREGPGNWHDDVLPWVAGSRPRLFVDERDNLLLIYNRPNPGEAMEHGIYFTRGDLVIASASAASNWQDWHIVMEEKGPFINEMLADPTRWKSERVLSVIAQETPKVIGTPSPLHVIDYRETQ
jgi:rhamnogalacturonyl hydrolase YesR